MIRSYRHVWRQHWLWIVANLGALFPAVHLLWDAQMGNLSINPVADLTARTGQAAIVILLLTLAVTPVQIITGYNPVARIRKSLGLWAFAYALVHLWVFVGVDYGYSWQFIVQDGLVQKPYIVVGLLALLILLPLAVTSTRGWMQRLGKQWKRLHQLIYAAGVLAILHYIWVAKVFWGQPVYYAIGLGLLLAVRVPPVRRAIVQWRRGRSGKAVPAQTPKRGKPSTAPRRATAGPDAPELP